MFKSSPDIDRRKCLPNKYTFSRARIRGLQTRYIWIKENFRKPFSVEAAAAEARMSASALHLHFKAVTRLTSPTRSMPPQPPLKWATNARRSSAENTAGNLVFRP